MQTFSGTLGEGSPLSGFQPARMYRWGNNRRRTGLSLCGVFCGPNPLWHHLAQRDYQ